VALLLAAAAALSACGDGDKPQARATATPTPAHTPPPSTQVIEGDGELAVGITEPNPSFVRTDDVAPEFARWRDALHKMRPTYYRLSVDWAGNTTPDGATIDFAKPNPGCMRDVAPCAGYNGVRDQLAAIASAQKASGSDRWQVMVVLSGTPEQLARPASGCERSGTQPRSRPPTQQGLLRYQEFIVKLLDEARARGVELRWWSPWNEPNHPAFIASQRATCSGKAKSLATEPYAEIARAMKKALDGYPGKQEMVLGETAGLLEHKPSYTDVPGFIRGLPKDVVCAARAYGQHFYIGGDDPVDAVAKSLRRFDCARTHEIWITETGAGRARSGEDRNTTGKAQRRACRQMHRRLVRWYEDPRVTAAFQYTLREDDRFPTGLVTTDLEQAYPALKEWQAWGDREPTEPAPKSRC
jgi:hypothetical protein